MRVSPITLDKFAERYLNPAVDKLIERFCMDNPELMKRARRNARRRQRYAEKKAND